MTEKALSARCRRLFALVLMLLAGLALAGCSGGNANSPLPPIAGEPGGGGGGGGGDDQDPPLTSGLPGDPDDPAVAVVADIYGGPVAAEDIDEAGVLLSRVMVQFRRDATVGEVNAAIDAVDGEIAFSRAGSLAMDLAIPRAQNFEALEELLDLLESQPGVIAATWDEQAQVEILPQGLGGQPVDPDTLRHLLPTRFPAAWNAAGRLTDTNCDAPLRIIMPDAFARTIPAFFTAKVAPGLFVPDAENRPGFLDDSSTHGYQVALTMLGRHDERLPAGALPVGLAPGASCVRVEAVEMAGLGSTDRAVRLSERLSEPTSNVIVQMSIGFGLPRCRGVLPGLSAECTQDLNGLTQRHLERVLMHRIEATLRWAAVGIPESVSRQALFVMAAGNERNKAVAVLYPGFGKAQFAYFPQMLAALPRLLELFGPDADIVAADLWEARVDAAAEAGLTIPAELTRIALPEIYLLAKLEEFAALGAAERAHQTVQNTIEVGSTALPGFDGSRTDARDLAESDFSNVVIRPRGMLGVGEGLSLGVAGDNDGANRTQGTSFAAPQVSGLAAYLWLLSPELRARPAAETARHIAENAQSSATITAAEVIDAYAAVLALDQFDDERPMRKAILDVNNDGRFDDRDIELYLEAFEASREASFNLSTDFSRFDLNGDGRTGGERTVPMDLDGFSFDAFGRAVLSDQVSLRIDGVDMVFDEFAVSDIQALCYFAYEASGLYRGTAQRRSELLGESCGVPPIALSTIFPQAFIGSANLDVLVTRQPPAEGGEGEPLPGVPLRFVASCGSLSREQATTDGNGRANTTLTLSPACAGSVSISIEALSEDGETVRVSRVVTANVLTASPSIFGRYVGSYTCQAQDHRFSAETFTCGTPAGFSDSVTLRELRTVSGALCGGDVCLSYAPLFCGTLASSLAFDRIRAANLTGVSASGSTFATTATDFGFTGGDTTRVDTLQGSAQVAETPAVLTLSFSASEARTSTGAAVINYSCEFTGERE